VKKNNKKCSERRKNSGERTIKNAAEAKEAR
jgi:hypothetical protein